MNYNWNKMTLYYEMAEGIWNYNLEFPDREEVAVFTNDINNKDPSKLIYVSSDNTIYNDEYIRKKYADARKKNNKVNFMIKPNPVVTYIENGV